MRTRLGFVAAAVVWSGTALAAPLTAPFLAIADGALDDEWGQNGGHLIELLGAKDVLGFEKFDGSGTFRFDPKGIATLTMSVYGVTSVTYIVDKHGNSIATATSKDFSKRLNATFSFMYRGQGPRAAGHGADECGDAYGGLRELRPDGDLDNCGAYADRDPADEPFGSPEIDTDEWHYFDLIDATMVGMGDFAGLGFSIAPYPGIDKDPGGDLDYPFPFQIGRGANGKEIRLSGDAGGISGYFEWAVTANTYKSMRADGEGLIALGTGDRGSVNGEWEIVPEPASTAFVLLGCVGLLARRRRRQSTIA